VLVVSKSLELSFQVCLISCFMNFAKTIEAMFRSLRAAAKAANQGQTVKKLLLSGSEDLACKNIMCAKFEPVEVRACACKLARFLLQTPLKEMEELDVSKSGLDALPVTVFTELPSLRVLRAEENLLTEIPQEIENLKCLEELYLDRNRLKGLPFEALRKLPHLKKIHICGNQDNLEVSLFIDFVNDMHENTEILFIFE